MKRAKPMARNRTMDMHSTEYAHSMARGLGWFSIGLGLAEVLAPRVLTRGLGMEGNEQLVRAYGLREIATGIGILSSDQPAPWIWGRVGGDALDMATLAAGLQPDNPKKYNVEMALAAVAGVTARGASTSANPSPIENQPNPRAIECSVSAERVSIVCFLAIGCSLFMA